MTIPFGPYDGYLSDPSAFNGILILLREPNTRGAAPEGFWMRDVVVAHHGKRGGKSYYDKLSKYVEFLGSTLENCAFSNLNLSGGYGAAGQGYQDSLLQFRTPDWNHHAWRLLLDDRIKIILTVWDIANAIFSAMKKYSPEEVTGFSIGKRKEQKYPRELRAFQFTPEGSARRKTVYTIYHPSARGKNSYTASDIGPKKLSTP